jgi:hypothetical protein
MLDTKKTRTNKPHANNNAYYDGSFIKCKTKKNLFALFIKKYKNFVKSIFFFVTCGILKERKLTQKRRRYEAINEL